MAEPIRVAVLGRDGRMGSEAVRAVDAAPDLELVAALGRGDGLEQLLESRAEVVVDLTVPAATRENVRFAVSHGLHAVVGTTGWDRAALDELEAQLAESTATGVLIAPNFAVGAVLAMKFSELAARFFDSVEVVELHHPRKLDAPSGTAARTAALVAAARQRAGVGASPDATESDPHGARGAVVDGVHVHSVRLQGLVAHQETLLGNTGEQLTVRHDSFDRASFMSGVLLGIRRVAEHPGLTHGLDGYMDLGL
ncbi:4-hydroxy-tetrahydrodipicolinate reductase [Kocuria rhizophila]|uniref:4-hydroxy-tetrahydrodipicolinate reductase n=1 Tax=Kocuria TaxID=57493 RepID=UPI00064DA10D|nr:MULTISPECIES: 4-hydroxy-tetrahydrodipicolinate reductase [Kocuria]KMK73491.1 4-hydroxy-tetrahydrodipicolinate reductase [Kocuria rhizophila]MCR4526582.1 4-hydroxy-tetrahydrodipicolinate reductase [Kocuria rhizophila]MCT1546484.1 4-hydroxy-tetrahydrodipicolinate reductase [Kocuria rhizophila]MCT1917854.1 4-hydroxy-tetrahydrodipicolinate reductase [Kocuria rhizophila]MCT2172181.1 4-hydroxy-tetrahydrodipicolinate reductase [Kocuria rhizophila]